jgi:cytochrome subunit of sulfide dehydrogenase
MKTTKSLKTLIHRVLLVSAILGGTHASSQAAGPPDGGRLLASGCAQCHGTNGLDGGFNTLAGNSQTDMLNKLNDMRTKPAGASIMNPHADGYSADDLYWITLYYSKLPKP